METLCTIIAAPNGPFEIYPHVESCVPLKEAIERADKIEANPKYKQVRVYAETNGGTTLTLIYQPT